MYKQIDDWTYDNNSSQIMIMSITVLLQPPAVVVATN